MRHDQGCGGGEFDGKITVGYSIQGVFAYSVKFQQIGNILAVDRVTGTRQCGSAER